MHQLEYLMEVGMLFDEEERYKEAEKTYTSAIDMALKAVSVCMYAYYTHTYIHIYMYICNV